MCLIAIAYRVHPSHPLIIAANRDEFYDRPATPLHFWDDFPDILAGRDLKSHGTWLGVSKKGKIAAITNYRDPGAPPAGGISRGLLVSGYLAGNTSPEHYLEAVAKHKDDYEGFNLIAGNINRLLWYSNRDGKIAPVSPGIHGLSNALLDTPWPKVETIKGQLACLTENKTRIDKSDLFAMLEDASRPPDDMLPDTGIGLSWERTLSPIFITSSTYGTRCSSVIITGPGGKIDFCERTFERGKTGTTRCYAIFPEKR